MTVSTIPPVTPILKFFDNNGNPLQNGQLFTYATQSSTKQATYVDSTGNNPNQNPIVLNARGEASIWLDSSLVYKFVLAPSTDTDPPSNPIWTQDPIGAFSITQITGNFSTVTVSSTITGANVIVTGSAVPANGIYLPATNRLGFATNTKARGYIDATGIWNILAPDASGPVLSIAAQGINNPNTIQLTTAGALIAFARSSDGAINQFVGSRAGTASLSLYNSGGGTSEVEAGGAVINLKTSGTTALSVGNNGNVTVVAPVSGVPITAGSNFGQAAGGSLLNGVGLSSAANFGIFCGSGAPTLVAGKGSIYLRSDGSSTTTRAYVATDSAGTWTNFITTA